MFKKIASIALAAALIGSTAVIAASAAEAEESVAAVDESTVGAEDGSEATGASTKIFFDALNASSPAKAHPLCSALPQGCLSWQHISHL